MTLCCCRNDASQSAVSSGKGAPNSQSINDRGRDLTEDEQAVQKWRERSPREHTGGARPDGDADIMTPQRLETGRSSESQRERVEQRNPLEKTYEIQRELPLRPKDGDTLISPQKKMATTPSTADSSHSLEVFEPSISPPQVTLKRRQSPSSQEEVELERITTIIFVADADEEASPPATPVKKAIKPDPIIIAASEDTRKLSLTEKSKTEKKKKCPSRNFVEVGGLMIPQSSQGVPPEKEDLDHLSDVPSDVDSVSKERYILACHLLKKTLIAKERVLVPIERHYILSLLGDYEKEEAASSVVSEDRVSAIEKAALRLEQDPLFQDNQFYSPEQTTSPLAASRAASRQKSATNKQEEAQPKPIPKHRHTATQLPRKTPYVSLLCNPLTPKAAGVLEDKEETRMMCNPLTLKDAGVLEDKEETNTTILKEATFDDYDAEPRSLNDEKLVRYDGWSFHKLGDRYPFQILGVNDDAQQGVLTPPIMEAFRGFFPYSVSESNFWLKFSLRRDGSSLATLLSSVRASAYTIICVETEHGEVFGSFTGSPWRTGTHWFGSGEAFLWRQKNSRLTLAKNSKESDFENTMEVYPFTGYDELVQYCTPKTMAIGGGDWGGLPCPFEGEPRGIGFMVDGDLQGGETNSCATFANPRLSKRVSSSNEFTISNLEVWTMTPCFNVEEAEKLELKKLFIEENRR
jgi:hypothetical protein